MKKILFASTALVAAGLVATSAQAAEPIKLSLGGYSTWIMGTAGNDDRFLRATGTQDPWLDLQGDSEIYFTGSTKLDNGLSVGVSVEMKAEQGSGNAATSTSIDKSNVFVSGGFGKLILGGEDNGVYLLSVTSTSYGIGANDSFLSEGRWVMAPNNFTGQTASAIDTGNPALNKITYVTPTFSGFTAGISYIPGVDQAWGRDNFTFANSGTVGEAWGAAAQYKGSFSGVDIGVSAGYVNTDVQAERDTRDEYGVGMNIAYMGFSVGGSWRGIDADRRGVADSADGYVVEAGISYGTGPYGIALNYFRSEAEGSTTVRADDEEVVWSLNGSYEMGPGVVLVGSVAHVDFDGETTLAAENNDGWAALAGLKLSF